MHRQIAMMAAAILVLGSGCDEIKSRREIQQGNKLYAEGHYDLAAAKFDSALQRTPDLAIGQLNDGLAYYKQFQSGIDTPQNKAMGEKAALHFKAYLESYPNDHKVIDLLSQLWIDSGQYDQALAYWQNVLAKDPGNDDVIKKLAGINAQAGRYDKAMEWEQKRVAAAKDKGAKVAAYMDIGVIQHSRLMKGDMVDADRTAIADVGIGALQQAAALDPSQAQIQSTLGAMYQLRALAHGAGWARLIDSANQTYHLHRFRDLNQASSPQKTANGQAPPAPKK